MRRSSTYKRTGLVAVALCMIACNNNGRKVKEADITPKVSSAPLTIKALLKQAGAGLEPG